MTSIEKWLSVAIFFAVGLWCVLGAYRMQQSAIRASENMKVNPFRSYNKSPAYLIVIRIGGFSVMLVALLLALVFIFGKE
jgi:hypothetical protein